MKLQTAPLILLPLLAHSAAIASRDVPAGPWAAGAWRPAPDDPIFFVGDILNAAGGHFWLHQNTTAYCPSEVEGIDCSAYSNNTAFLGGNDTVALYTGVPGGQQVYVASDGALAYTSPHSATLPDGANATGFLREMSQAFGAPIVWGVLGKSWQLCPVPSNATEVTRDGVFQLYLSDQTLDGCYATEMRTYTTSTSPAWEFT